MPTLDEARLTFLQVDRSSHTNHQYSLVLGRLVAAIGPERDIALVRYEDLVDYFARLKTRGLKPSTRESYLAVTKSFFNWCAERGYINRSPARDIRVRMPPSYKSKARPIPQEELRRMVEFTRVTGQHRNFAMLLFLADTGCRVGGLVSLRLRNLNLVEGTALLIEKGDRLHKALFGPDTAEALQTWLERRPEVDHDYVWTGQGPGYKQLSSGGAAAIVRRLATRTGASYAWGPHSIRHAVGHAYAKAGIPVTITQQKLGHSAPTITMEFYYPDDDEYLRQVSRENPLAPLHADPPEPMLRLVKGHNGKKSSS